MINKLQLDILRRHAGPFIFCFITVMFLLLMQFLILYVDKLVGKGLPLGIIIELILTNLAYMVVLAAPMAVLVASLMAYGKFSELNELTALKAAGVNPIHVITPVLGVAIFLSLGLMYFSNYILPDANQRARSLFIDIRLKKPGFDLNPGEFYEGIEGYTFLVEEINEQTDSLYNVTLIQEPTSRQSKAIIKAEKGVLGSEEDGQTLTLYLLDGSVLRYLDRRNNHQVSEVFEKTNFNKYRINFDLSDLAFSRSNPDQHNRNDRTMKVETMLAVVDSLKNEINKEKDKKINKSSSLFMPDEQEYTNQSLDFNRLNSENESVKPYSSNYEVLDMLTSRRAQMSLHSTALHRLRDQKSDLENLNINIEWRTKRIARYMVEVHKKFSIPLACIIFVLLGAPIGMYTRKGNLGYAALISTFFLTFYWISIIQGEKMADRLYITPFMGMWSSNILLTLIGIYLVTRLCTSFKISNLWKS